MFQVASGSGLAVGLASTDGPPLSPETIGRSPSFLEAPAVPVRPLSEVLGAVLPAPRPAPAAEDDTLPPALGERRVVVRLVGGEELALGAYPDRGAAVAAAQGLIGTFATAESSGEWPEVEGRFLRPASVVSIDVLVEA